MIMHRVRWVMSTFILFEKYINNNPQVDWFTDKYKTHMFERAYSLMANLIGQQAANLEMVDTKMEK